jgi:hypothetical protein
VGVVVRACNPSTQEAEAEVKKEPVSNKAKQKQ